MMIFFGILIDTNEKSLQGDTHNKWSGLKKLGSQK